LRDCYEGLSFSSAIALRMNFSQRFNEDCCGKMILMKDVIILYKKLQTLLALMRLIKAHALSGRIG
jgi:hypothetical protein